MPIYEYHCPKCKATFELLRGINADDKDLVCSKCGAPEPKKIFSSFAAVGNGKTAACQTGST